MSEIFSGSIPLSNYDSLPSYDRVGCFPTKNIVPQRLAEAKRKEAFAKSIQLLDVQEQERITNALANLDKQDIENLQKFVQAVEIEKTWSSRYLFSSLIAAASTILAGSSLFSSRVIPGLAISGGLQFFNTLIDYHKGWQSAAQLFSFGDQTKEEIIRTVLPFATNLFILAFTTYTTLTLPPDDANLMDTLSQYVGYVNIAMGAIAIVNIYKKNVAETRLNEGQNKRFEYAQESEIVSQEFEFHVETFRTISQEDKKATEKYIQATSSLAARTR
jgi:hypothetical protein